MNSGQQKDFEVQQPPTDGISHLSFSPAADFLACSSWDQQLRIYEVQSSGNTVGKLAIPHDAPVLCTAWSPDGNQVFSAGAARQGKLLDLATGQSMPYAQHDAPIKAAFYCSAGPMQNLLVTGSWDKTVKYWDLRSPGPVGGIALPERCYTMDVTYPLMTVGTAERHIVVVNLQNMNTIYKSIQSPLKFQTRCVANFPDKTGFAVGSIEGRVAIHNIEEKDQGSNFSFKCHRDGNNVFAVNAISFHPQYGTFSTSGSDGTINFWDKDSKQRLKTFNNAGQSISATAFNRDGRIFAYAASYDWSKGHEFKRVEDKDKIFLHAVKDEDIKPRVAVKKR